MPDHVVKTRNVTLTGGSVWKAFAYNVFPGGPNRIQSQGAPHIQYLDVDCSLRVTILSESDGSGGTNWWARATVFRDGGTTQDFDGTKTNFPAIALGAATSYITAGAGSLTISDSRTITCYQAGHVPQYERETCTASSFSASITGLTVDLVVGGVVVATFSPNKPSGTLSHSDGAGVDRAMVYGHVFLWPALDVSGNNCILTWSDATLASQYGSFGSASVDGCTLSGSPANATAQMGTPYWSLNAPPSGNWLLSNMVWPSAELRCLPSWAIQVNADVRDYWTGAAVDTTIEDAHSRLAAPSTVVRTTFSSLSGKRIPASGSAHSLYAGVVGGQIEYGTGGAGNRKSFNGGTVDLVAHTAANVYLPFGTDPLAGFQTTWDVTAAGISFQDPTGSHFLQPDPAWCEANGQQPLRRDEPIIDPTGLGGVTKAHLKAISSPSFLQASLTFVSFINYKLFDASNHWHVQDNAAFLAANSGYTSNVTITEVGGALQVTVNDAGKKALIYSGGASPYNLKPFAHRYASLHIQADAASAPFKFGLLSQSVGADLWGPVLVWSGDTGGTANTYVDPDFDLPQPPSQGVIGGGGAFSYASNSDLVHQATYYPDGATVWVELEAGATYLIDYLKGHHGTGETIRLYYPLDVLTGDDAAEAERSAVGFGMHAIRVESQGARLWDDGPVDYHDSQDTFWQRLYSRLDTTANDTGVSVVPGSSGYETYPILDGTAFSEMFAHANDPGIRPGLGFVQDLTGQLRCYPFASSGPTVGGYYGQGDPASASYSSTVVWNIPHWWGGERLGLVGKYTVGLVSMSLIDNNSGSTLSTAAFFYPGFYRMHGKSGYIFPTDPAFPFAAQWTGTPPTSYTALGLLLNSHWIRENGLTAASDSSLIIIDGGARRIDYEVWDRYPIWLDFYTRSAAATGGALIQDYLGRLHAVDAHDGNIRYRRADRAVLPFVADVPVTTTGTDSEPAFDMVGDRIWLLWQRGSGDVYQSWSDDDGASFSTEALLAMAAKHPAARKGNRGDLLRAYYDGGVIKGIYRSPAGVDGSVFTFKDAAGSDISVEDDVISFDQADESGERWTVFWRILGDTEPSLWVSADEGLSWSPA
jgi:hypothetical protein